MPTVSIVKGKGYARHNDRSLSNKSLDERSWDPDKTDLNIVYKNEPIKQEYEKVFGKALAEYNQKQIDKGRPDRQIQNYYEKICRSKQEKESYELIVQIGAMEDKTWLDYEQIQSALNEYNLSFQERNPNFHVFQQITHLDEKGMDHTHIMFFPVSTGNRRGLETKNSLSGALKEMGFDRNGFDQWRQHEMDQLSEIMKRHNLEIKMGDGRSEHLNVRQYREYKKYESLTLEKQNTLSELEKSVSRAKSDLDGLDYRKSDINAQIAQKVAQIEELERKKEVLQKNPSRIVADNPKIETLVQDFIVDYKSQKESQKAEFANDYGTDHDDRAIAEYLTDHDVTIKKSLFGEEMVTMPYSKWEQIKENHNNLVEKFKDLRQKFLSGVDRLIRLFTKAREEPEYLKALKDSNSIKDLKAKNEELEINLARIQTQNQNAINYLQAQNQEQAAALEVLDILGLQMEYSTFINPQTGMEENLLDSLTKEAELSWEAKQILTNRIENYKNSLFEDIDRDRGWER